MMANKRDRQAGASIWERVISSGALPSVSAARALLKLQFPGDDLQRIKDLMYKARRGELSAEEGEELSAYEQLGCLLDIVHSQARRVLKRAKSA